MFDGMFTLEIWRHLVEQIGHEYEKRFNLTVTDDWFSKLSIFYDQPWRKFHNEGRVSNLLKMLNGHAREIALDPLSLKMAIWFYAVDFIPGNTGNEQKSMGHFQSFATEINLPKAFSAMTCCLILAPTTETQRTADGILFADLLNLFYGNTWESFCATQDLIRDEHLACGQSSDSVYQTQNAAKLRHLLTQDRIFNNRVFLRTHEENAQNNIARWLESASP